MIHATAFEHAGRTMSLAAPLELNGRKYGGTVRVEDWWDRVSGSSWAFSRGNPAALMYAVRIAFCGTPDDDEVVYGKDEFGLGHLLHVTELGTVSA